MEGVKLTIALIIAVLLQWSLRNVSEVFAYVDLPLIIIVYAALQRNSIRALIFGTLAGLSIDALSGGLLGSQGFAKTLIAFVVSEIARRVYLDNLLLRIPVLIGACVVNSSVRTAAARRIASDRRVYADRYDSGRNSYLPTFRELWSRASAAKETRYVFAEAANASP
jgi:rod shape-determining protein MreD